MGRIASAIEIPVTRVDRIFDEDDGQLIFCGDVSVLGKSKAEKVAALAILLLAGRRWTGIDEGGPTRDAIVRSEVDRLGLLDTTNYSKHIAALKSYVTITGRGKEASYKIKYDGLEKAKLLGRSVAGSE